MLMVTLAQFFDQQPPPMPINGPPVLEGLLFESPWGPAAVLVLAGVAAFWAFNRAGRVRLGVMVVAVAAAAAVGIVGIASMVTTDREVVGARTRELVAAVARGDAPGAAEYLAPTLSVRLVGVTTNWGKEEVLQRIERELNGVYRLKDREARVRTLRAGDEPPSSIRTQVRVSVTPEMYALPTETWWLLMWRKQPDGLWRVMELDVQQIEGVKPGTRIE
jgi:hypothetical protein